MQCPSFVFLTYSLFKKILRDLYFKSIKDAMPVSFRSELITSYILTIFKQRNLLA